MNDNHAFGQMVAAIEDYAIFLLDEQGFIQSWNKGASLIKQYSPQEVIGKHFSLFYTEEDLGTGLPARLLELARTRGKASDEGYRRRRDGSLFWAHVTITGLHNEAGALIGFSKITRDMTSRRQEQLKLEASEAELRSLNTQLQSSNADLEQFAYVASHDLQEPLRMVSSFLQLLREEYGTQLNEEALEYIRFAVNGAERMKRMIRDLLHYSQLNSAGFKDEIVDTSFLVTELIQEMDEEIERKKAHVKLQTLPIVYANRSLVQQLFQNLIGNALKYNRSESPLVEIGSETAEGRPVFFVKDNGIGIEPEYHDKVFQVFQRLHNKKEFEGNGIGLSICRKIVEKHNGRIWIENPDQGGTAFKFTLS